MASIKSYYLHKLFRSVMTAETAAGMKMNEHSEVESRNFWCFASLSELICKVVTHTMTNTSLYGLGHRYLCVSSFSP